MDKLKMETPDMAAENIEKIGTLFPSVVTEMQGEDGSIKKGINFEMLKQLLSPDVVEEGDERYELTWVGKKQAMAEVARPTTKTLRPVKEDSRNWDTTENLYIEGDNLEVLKILQESYLGKVKMIYIDPPYNTGHDFLYKDNYCHSQIEEDYLAGAYDEEDNRLFENTESNGRFHSDWCSMIYSRLRLARNFLSNDGVMFISIDENEFEKLLLCCREVFGDEQVEYVLWRKVGDGDAGAGRMKITYRFRCDHEYIIMCFRNKNSVYFNRVLEIPQFKNEYSNPDGDPRGPYKAGNISKDESKSNPNGKNYYTVVSPSGKAFTRQWHFSREEFDRLNNEQRIYWGKNLDAVPSIKIFVNEPREIVPSSILLNAGSATMGNKECEAIFGNRIFDNPKPLKLMRFLVERIKDNRDIVVLDFFSGSATTAHAVMQLNAEDGGHRKFIMVQLPEPCDEKSEAFKAGYKNICEIGKERIRRAGDKIKAEHPDADLDIGFRVFRVDESNMKNVYYHPEEVTQLMLGETVGNIKEDRTGMDLLYACLLDWGVEINLPHTSTQVAGCTVHNVDNGALVACFDKAVPRAVVEYMANLQPLRAVFRDSAFATDAEKINVTEIFKNLSPDTKVKVI